MNIIGLTGLAGTGKDTAAEYFIEQGYAPWAFAAPIRNALIYGFGLSEEYFDDRVLKETVIEDIGKSPRELMQLFGTDFARNMLGNDIWVKVNGHILNQFFIAPENADVVGLVLTDVRFDNEAEYIKSKGGIIVEITRPNTSAVANHVSEQGIDRELIDVSVPNDGDIALLHINMEEIHNKLSVGGLHAIAANS